MPMPIAAARDNRAASVRSRSSQSASVRSRLGPTASVPKQSLGAGNPAATRGSRPYASNPAACAACRTSSSNTAACDAGWGTGWAYIPLGPTSIASSLAGPEAADAAVECSHRVACRRSTHRPRTRPLRRRSDNRGSDGGTRRRFRGDHPRLRTGQFIVGGKVEHPVLIDEFVAEIQRQSPQRPLQQVVGRDAAGPQQQKQIRCFVHIVWQPGQLLSLLGDAPLDLGTHAARGIVGNGNERGDRHGFAFGMEDHAVGGTFDVERSAIFTAAAIIRYHGKRLLFALLRRFQIFEHLFHLQQIERHAPKRLARFLRLILRLLGIGAQRLQKLLFSLKPTTLILCFAAKLSGSVLLIVQTGGNPL